MCVNWKSYDKFQNTCYRWWAVSVLCLGSCRGVSMHCSVRHIRMCPQVTMECMPIPTQSPAFPQGVVRARCGLGQPSDGSQGKSLPWITAQANMNRHHWAGARTSPSLSKGGAPCRAIPGSLHSLCLPPLESQAGDIQREQCTQRQCKHPVALHRLCV